MRWIDRLPLFAGPLVLAGFFLPWVEGRGLLAGSGYNGYELMQITAWLGEADPSTAEALLLGGFRMAAAGLVVAGIVLTLAAPRMRGHAVYRFAGVYAVAASAGAFAFALYWGGPGAPLPLPLPGISAMLAGAACWAAPGLAVRIRRSRERDAGVAAISASSGS